MEYEIILSPQAVEDLRLLRAHDRSKVRDAMQRFLVHEPERVGRSRIKRLRGRSHPQYRLRVGDIRVFYDVTASEVRILAVLMKSRANEWLDQAGEQE